jgi:hypothetical protein
MFGVAQRRSRGHEPGRARIGRGDIQVSGPATSTPQPYFGSDDCYIIIGGGYDNKGNLFVAAESSDYHANICDLPAGGHALTAAAVDQTIDNPAGIMWDGQYLAVADDLQAFNAYKTVILQLKEGAHGGLTVVGKSVLADTCYKDEVEIYPQPFIVGKRNTPVNRSQGDELIGRNFLCGIAPAVFGLWAYPAGGNPSRSLALDSGAGVVVSIGE